MNYGIQDDGSFRRKHVDRIREDMRRAFKDELGDDVELNPGSPQAQILDAIAIEIGRQWQATEETYYASFFEDSFGQQLDKHVSIAGFSRLPLRPATGEVTFARETAAPDDITIPSGTVVRTTRTDTRPPIPFETTEAARINEGETEVAGVGIEALKPWQTELDEEWLGEATNVAANTIARFQSPVSGVDSVTNPAPTGDRELGFTRGRDRETDAELKARYVNELGAEAAATLAGIEAAIFNADPAIEDVTVNERHDSAADEYGIEPIVLAPTVGDDIIAQAILDSRAGGVESFGSTTGAAEFDGDTLSIPFDRATRTDIFVDVTVQTDATFPVDGTDRVSDAIVEYIGGTTTDDVAVTGLTIGDNVVADQVRKQVLNVQGVVELTLTLGTSDPPSGDSNVAIPDDETARADETTIAITVS